MRLVWIGIALLLSLPAEAQSPATMRGSWYTEGTENGIRAQFTLENRTDGTFIKKIRDITNCRRPKSWIETGHWSFSASRLKLITETVEGHAVDRTDPEYIDFFDVKGDDNHFAMFDIKTMVTWQVDKVSSDFQIPADCGTV